MAGKRPPEYVARARSWAEAWLDRADEPVAVVRRAFAAYARGDVSAMMRLVDPDLEWTFLDPSELDPQPRVCHGRDQLESALRRRADQGLRSAIEEVVGSGDRVMVVEHIPGLDARRARRAGDRNFHVLTVRGGRIAALRACRDRAEAAALAGIA
jgi:ketosteroid isomerase-like protein